MLCTVLSSASSSPSALARHSSASVAMAQAMAHQQAVAAAQQHHHQQQQQQQHQQQQQQQQQQSAAALAAASMMWRPGFNPNQVYNLLGPAAPWYLAALAAESNANCPPGHPASAAAAAAAASLASSLNHQLMSSVASSSAAMTAVTTSTGASVASPLSASVAIPLANVSAGASGRNTSTVNITNTDATSVLASSVGLLNRQTVSLSSTGTSSSSSWGWTVHHKCLTLSSSRLFSSHSLSSWRVPCSLFTQVWGDKKNKKKQTTEQNETRPHLVPVLTKKEKESRLLITCERKPPVRFGYMSEVSSSKTPRLEERGNAIIQLLFFLPPSQNTCLMHGRLKWKLGTHVHTHTHTRIHTRACKVFCPVSRAYCKLELFSRPHKKDLSN